MKTCKYFGLCGGCSLQNIPYDEQLVKKEKTLKDLFLRGGFLKKIPPIEIIYGSEYGYRERFQFHRVPNDNLAVGFSAYHSNTIIPIDDCLIASPVLRAALREKKIKAPITMNRWNVYGRGNLLLQENPGASDKIPQRGKIKICNRELIVDAALFFQSNGAMLEKLIERVVTVAQSATKKAGDFYCGVGTFAIFLQDIFQGAFQELDLLEENAAALKLAKENLLLNSHAGASLKCYPQSDTQWANAALNKSNVEKMRYEFLCVDPAREGLSPAMRKWLCALPPKTLCYVSCNPRALVRDLKALTENGGLNLQSLTIYDFYPQTTHIETLAVLSGA